MKAVTAGDTLEPEAAVDPEQRALAALDAGDREETLRVLMDAYGRVVYRYCRQMLGAPDLADDAHQTTFVQAYQGLSGFRRQVSFRAWLFGIARHRCLDALRSRRRRDLRFEGIDALGEAAAAAPAGQEARVHGDALARALARCLQGLAPRSRTAVLLRCQEGFSYAEMAQACGDREGALRVRVVRALPALRECLKQQGFAP